MTDREMGNKRKEGGGNARFALNRYIAMTLLLGSKQ